MCLICIIRPASKAMNWWRFDLYLLADTGAYGTHGLTVPMAGGFKGLSIYNPPNARFRCDVVYTNTAPAGAFRGYGSMQCMFAIDVLMEEIAEKLGIDVVDFKRKNLIKEGEPMLLAAQMGERPRRYPTDDGYQRPRSLHCCRTKGCGLPCQA